MHEHEYLYGVDAALEKLDEAVDLVDRQVRSMKDSGLSARGAVVSGPFGRPARAILA